MPSCHLGEAHAVRHSPAKLGIVHSNPCAVCIGIHLARMELRLATALFFRTFPQAHVSTKEGMSAEDMEMKSYFLMSPKGHRCLMEG